MHDLDVVDKGLLSGNPHWDHIVMILGFARDVLSDDGVRAVFQCTAGRRRSAAAALISDLAVQKKNGVAITPDLIVAAWDHMIRLRDIADPNRALLQLGDAQLGLNGALTQYAHDRPRFLQLDPID